MRLFFDACISHRVADAVKCLIPPKSDLVVCSVHERYGKESVPDVEWLADLGTEGDWIILSADVAIQRSAVERTAWISTAVDLGHPIPDPSADELTINYLYARSGVRSVSLSGDSAPQQETLQMT